MPHVPLVFLLGHSGESHISEHLGFSRGLLWTEASRRDLDRDVIIHRFTDLLTLTTPDAAFSRHNHALRIKIHQEGLCRTLRRTGMTTLRRRAYPMQHRREPHANLVTPCHRQQGFRGTGADTRHIFAEVARNLVRKNHRCSILLVEDNRAVRAGFCTIAASGAPIEK